LNAELVALGILHHGQPLQGGLDRPTQSDNPIDLLTPGSTDEVEVDATPLPLRSAGLAKEEGHFRAVDGNGRICLGCAADRGQARDFLVVVRSNLESTQRVGPEPSESRWHLCFDDDLLDTGHAVSPRSIRTAGLGHSRPSPASYPPHYPAAWLKLPYPAVESEEHVAELF
jgi:hypothetical protein